VDPQALGRAFAEHGRLQIHDFLTSESVNALYQELAESSEWRLTANRGEEIHHFNLEDLERWTPEQHKLLDQAVSMGGRFGFQFRYEVIRLHQKSAGLLAEFRDFMSSPDVVRVMRQIVGAPDIAFADAHASRYQPGHFLTTHDDHVDTMGRRAAYVMNLTPKWRPDWGGLLQFFDRRGDVVRAFTPGFNLLNLFRVPQAHNVSWVTPLAAAPRYAITGWLRAGT
jgi:Rps23 Pro-64 3,4-dihydroxylase Tpa1-like proline 4-hydroxylase